MKNIITAFFVLTLSSLQAQNVSDFKYVIVPQKFTDFEKNDFKLNVRLRTYLKRKNYEVISEGSTEKPIELQNNSCLATKADIQKIKSTFKNKLKVVFTDCNNKTITEYEGISQIKDFEKGYQEALEFAMKQVHAQNASNQLSIQKKESMILDSDKKKNIDAKEIKKFEEPSTNPPQPTTEKLIYQSNGNDFYQIFTKDNQFLLVDSKSNKIIATFFPSSIHQIYHVEVHTEPTNYQTIGYLNGNNIIIEYKTSDKSWSPTTYSK